MDRKAIVNLPIDEYDELRNKIQALHGDLAKLQTKLDEARLVDSSGNIVRLLDVIMAAMPVIQFAVANLDPRAVVGWPHESLSSLADHLLKEDLPGSSPTRQELALELRAFAGEAATLERARSMPLPSIDDLEQAKRSIARPEVASRIDELNAEIASKPKEENG